MSLLLLRFSLTNIYWQYLTTGLDPSGYRQSARQQEMDDDDDALLGVEMSDEEKYNCSLVIWSFPLNFLTYLNI